MDITTYIGIPAIILALLSIGLNYQTAYKLKDRQSLIDAELEKYKRKLDEKLIDYKSGYEKELARLNSELKNFSDKMSLLNVKRADVINQLYQKLVVLQTRLMLLMIDSHSIIENENSEKTAVDVSEAYTEYYNFLSVNKLYFTPKLIFHLDKISDDCFRAYRDVIDFKQLNTMDIDLSIKKINDEKLSIAKTSIRIEIPKTIELVEREFRGILGVE